MKVSVPLRGIELMNLENKLTLLVRMVSVPLRGIELMNRLTKHLF